MMTSISENEINQEYLDRKITSSFPDVCIHKGLAAKSGLTGRTIPAFVSDWLVSRYSDGAGSINSDGMQKFVAKYLPDKKQKETLMYELRNGTPLKILDSFSVKVHPTKGTLQLRIPCLDLNGLVLDSIVDANPLLLMGNVWGNGTLTWMPSQEKEGTYDVVMTNFNPMQAASIDLGYFLAQRKEFDLAEWLALLARTMGYDERKYSTKQKLLILSRLLPLIEPRVNIMELAPKGTGKSFIYSQLSRHAWLVSGGVVTRAQLFYDMSRQRPGIISNFNTVILDEIQTIKLSNEGEIIGALKGYLESGEYRVMGFHGSSDAGFVILGNIPIVDGRPRDENCFTELPRWLTGHGATALLDRFHALVPGWELPRIQSTSLCQSFALRADYFGEVLYALRANQEHMTFVKDHMQSDGDLRDTRAVQRLACGYLKLLFPNLDTVTLVDFEKFCLQPAINLRSNIRQQMALLDPEFSPKIADINIM